LSCSDRRRAAAGVVLALTLLGGTAACGTGATADADPATSSMTSGTPADATTARLAEVEFARQCTVDAANLADESGFTADLDARLAGVGLTHAQWKRWHDALVDSPELVAQFSALSAQGCPGG
jgi:hypothetical protein